jgi:hypothetical protein
MLALKYGKVGLRTRDVVERWTDAIYSSFFPRWSVLSPHPVIILYPHKLHFKITWILCALVGL